MGLAGHIEADRAFAVRTLLASPVLDGPSDPDAFGAVVRQREWLVRWFDETCGWDLAVDVPARFARLVKRTTTPDPTRPARRSRTSSPPFDRRRYELLCLVAAELASHPVTTIGILASTLAGGGSGRLDTARAGERRAFVDALQLLGRLGVVRFEGGDVESFAASEAGNAIVVVDAGRLHRLLASATAPSKITAGSTAEAIEQLVAEARFGDVDTLEGDARNHHVRRMIARRLLDDPAVHTDELSEAERAYVGTPAGRRWLVERGGDAGLVVEARAEGMVAVDPDRLATDIVFPGPGSNVKQAALVLVDELVVDRFGTRELGALTRDAAAARVRRLLDEHPNWGKEYRDDGGAERLAGEAVALLAALHLARVDGDVVAPRPAIARYATAPVDDGGLFGPGGTG